MQINLINVKINYGNKKISECALCLKEKTLCDSHIIPSFVYKWLKDTSATGYLRNGNSPNLRQQDGLKIKIIMQ